MTRASENRRGRRDREKAEERKQRSLARTRKLRGEDAATDRVLAEQAERWAERQFGPGARGRVVTCACGSDFMSVIGTDGEPLVKQCTRCKGATT